MQKSQTSNSLTGRFSDSNLIKLEMRFTEFCTSSGFLHLLSTIQVEFTGSKHLDTFWPVPFYEGSRLHFSAPRFVIPSVNDQSIKISRLKPHPCLPVVSTSRTNIYKIYVLLNKDNAIETQINCDRYISMHYSFTINTYFLFNISLNAWHC